MLARNQKVLQQGVPSRDLAVLRTDYSYFNYGYEEGKDTPFFNSQMYDEPYYYSDLTLQHAGYTYDYFSPQVLLDEENISWTSDTLQPDGVAYKAVLVYQETMEKDAAEKLLAIAKDGLPVVFVDNIDETLTLTGEKRHNGAAASRSKFLNDSDEEVGAIIDEIKALDNVASVTDASEAEAALHSLGVYPRVAFEEPNNKITTISRNDKENGIYYTFAYSFKSEVNRGEEPYTFTLAIDGEGAPYAIDDWSGAVGKISGFEIKEGRTYVPLTLMPGESVIVALDLSETADMTENGTVKITEDEPVVLTDWNVTLEDWNEGEKVVNIEEKFGHTTTEVYFTTKKTEMPLKAGELMPWKDMEADGNLSEILGYEGAELKDISGIGTYETTFILPDDFGEGQGAYLKIADAGRGAVAVYVNGTKAGAVNTRTLTVDISDLVKAGENTVQIRVASTLYNRVLKRGYYDFLGEDLTWEPASYGITGDVQIVPYQIVF